MMNRLRAYEGHVDNLEQAFLKRERPRHSAPDHVAGSPL